MVLSIIKNIVKPNAIPASARKLQSKALGFTGSVGVVVFLEKVRFLSFERFGWHPFNPTYEERIAKVDTYGGLSLAKNCEKVDIFVNLRYTYKHQPDVLIGCGCVLNCRKT